METTILLGYIRITRGLGFRVQGLGLGFRAHGLGPETFEFGTAV